MHRAARLYRADALGQARWQNRPAFDRPRTEVEARTGAFRFFATHDMILVQVWALPALNLEDYKLSEFHTAGTQPVTVREVVYDPDGEPLTKVLLFETWDPAPEISGDLGSHFSLIGRTIARISFGTVTVIHAFAGRLALNPPEGAEGVYTFFEFQGCPPGILTHVALLRGPFQKVLDPNFSTGNVPANVEGAISWFIAGLHAAHPPVALMCNWLGIEMLAPEVKGKVLCPNKGCEKEIGKCPHCHQPTVAHKATKSVIEYLTKECGLKKSDAKDLYQGRNDVAHGRLKLDPSGLVGTIPMVYQTSAILLDGIKKALGWPKQSMPNVGKGMIHYSVGIRPASPLCSPFSRDFPISYKGWKDFQAQTYRGTYKGIRALAGMFPNFGM